MNKEQNNANTPTLKLLSLVIKWTFRQPQVFNCLKELNAMLSLKLFVAGSVRDTCLIQVNSRLLIIWKDRFRRENSLLLQNTLNLGKMISFHNSCLQLTQRLTLLTSFDMLLQLKTKLLVHTIVLKENLLGQAITKMQRLNLNSTKKILIWAGVQMV